MSAAQRGMELERFRSAPDVHVMLFSLMAGSTGLNLTVRERNGFSPLAALAWQQAAGSNFMTARLPVTLHSGCCIASLHLDLAQPREHHGPASLGKPPSRQGILCHEAGRGTWHVRGRWDSCRSRRLLRRWRRVWC